jgi:hypothetical protein
LQYEGQERFRAGQKVRRISDLAGRAESHAARKAVFRSKRAQQSRSCLVVERHACFDLSPAGPLRLSVRLRHCSGSFGGRRSDARTTDQACSRQRVSLYSPALLGRTSVGLRMPAFSRFSGGALGWTVEDECFVLRDVAEDHVLTWGLHGKLFYFGFRELETFRGALPYVRSILEFENV